MPRLKLAEVISNGWSSQIVDPGFGRELELRDLLVTEEDLSIHHCQQVEESTPHRLDLGGTRGEEVGEVEVMDEFEDLPPVRR